MGSVEASCDAARSSVSTLRVGNEFCCVEKEFCSGMMSVDALLEAGDTVLAASCSIRRISSAEPGRLLRSISIALNKTLATVGGNARL